MVFGVTVKDALVTPAARLKVCVAMA
jgi:hypothetical protein